MTTKQKHVQRMDPELRIPAGASEVFLTHLYCDHKGEWVKFKEPRNSSTGGNMVKIGEKMGIKVDAAVRKDEGSSAYTVCWVYLRVSDAETRAE